jgi:hypothetical protein
MEPIRAHPAPEKVMAQLRPHMLRLASALAVLALLLATSSAAAQSRDAEVPGPPRGKRVAPQGEQQPTLTQPLYLMVPGAVALLVGGVMFSQYPPGVDYAAYDGASIGLMGGGTVLMAGSLAYFGARIAKRVRWRRQRKWELCAQGIGHCSQREPKIYQPLYMFVPGVVLAAIGTGLLVKEAQTQVQASSYDDATDDMGYFQGGTACVGIAASLLIAASAHLAVRLHRRSDWRRHRGRHALNSVRVAPSIQPAVGATRFGLGIGARF